jgi:hypothetical protein
MLAFVDLQERVPRNHPRERDIMIVGADDQDPGPVARPFTDFLRVVRDEAPADYTYLWMIDLLPDDPQVFLDIVVSRRVEETFLFRFPVPQFTLFSRESNATACCVCRHAV